MKRRVVSLKSFYIKQLVGKWEVEDRFRLAAFILTQETANSNEITNLCGKGLHFRLRN